KSVDMAVNNYFDHNKPGYGSVNEQIQYFTGEVNPYTNLAENIAYVSGHEAVEVFELAGLEDRAMGFWEESETHYNEIMDPENTEVGIGAYSFSVGDTNYVVFTHLFIEDPLAEED